MTDRDALLRAIINHPDEDTPRLVYADWLDEHGEAKRAACIRAQVEHHRTAQADTAANAVAAFVEGGSWRGLDRIDWAAVDAGLGAALAAREAAGRELKQSAKAEGLPRVKGVTFYPGERGFYGHAAVRDTAAFLKHADAIFRAAPITDIAFQELTAEQARALVFSGHLARVRSLRLSAVEPDAIRTLGASDGAAGVRELELRPESFGELVPALAAGHHWAGLTRLEVPNMGEDDDPPAGGALAEMLARPQFSGLRTLDVCNHGVDDNAARVIATRLPELRHLGLAVNPISGTGWEALAASKSLQHLRRLELNACEVNDGGAASRLISTKNMPNLCVLKLDGNELDGLAPGVLTKPGRGPVLRVLDLGDSFLAPADVGALAACPAARGVWHLTLNNADLDDSAVEGFARRAAFDRLTGLDLSSNAIHAAGAQALAAWPGAANLRWLDLATNPIGETGAKALAASPHLSGLRYINATTRGAATLKKRFKEAFA